MSYGLGQNYNPTGSPDASAYTPLVAGTPQPGSAAYESYVQQMLSSPAFTETVAPPDTSNPFLLSNIFPATPATGGTPSAMPVSWLTIGLIGGLLLMFGLAMGKR